MSSLEKARVALEDLEKLVNINVSSKKALKMGVIYSLSSKLGRVYIGFEYEGNIEKELKDLLVRYVGYKSMGYLYESSAGVLEDGIVEFGVIEKLLVSSKYDLARKAEVYMLELGQSVCVNVYKAEELKRGFAIGLYEDDERLVEVERYKSEKEKELMLLGVDVVEYRKGRMAEIRSMKDELYEKIIKF
jgi:hypothetical protein